MKIKPGIQIDLNAIFGWATTSLLGQPPRMHSLCYLFSERADQADLVWREADCTLTGGYDLRHFVVGIDPEKIPPFSQRPTSRKVVAAHRPLADSELLISNGDYGAVRDRIISWDTSMTTNKFTRAALGQPRGFSYHPERGDGFAGGPGKGGAMQMVEAGWLAVAR
jgi:hypothetical protein